MSLEKKNFIFDSSLTLKAKGLLCTLLYLEQEGTTDRISLLSICKEGCCSINNGLKELEEAGYIEIKPLKLGRGQSREYLINHDKL